MTTDTPERPENEPEPELDTEGMGEAPPAETEGGEQ